MWVQRAAFWRPIALLRISCIIRECARWHPCSTLLHTVPMGWLKRLRCVTGRSSWEFSGTLNSLRARGKWGVFVRLACAGGHSLACCDARCAWALPSQYQEGLRRKVVADNGICRWHLKGAHICLGCKYLKETRSKYALSIE